MDKSGYDGTDIAEYGQPGSNGLTLDPQGRLTIIQQGNRRVIRMERDGQITVLADRYQGKRLNSPNDLVDRTPKSPWQNAFVERLVGSIRRECLDHVIVLGPKHLR